MGKRVWEIEHKQQYDSPDHNSIENNYNVNTDLIFNGKMNYPDHQIKLFHFKILSQFVLFNNVQYF